MKKILSLFISDENSNNILRLWKISLKHKTLLIFSIITLVINTFISLYLPIKLNGFAKIFTSNNVSQSFSNNGLSYFFFFSLNSIFTSFHHASIQLFIFNFVKSLREFYVKNLFTKDLEFFDTKKTSDLFSLLTEDIQTLTDSSILELFAFFKTIARGIGAIILMFYFYFTLSCFLVIILPIIGLILRRRCKKAKNEHKNIRDQRHSSHNIVLESLENIKTVKSFSTEEKEMNKYEIQLKKMMDEEYKFIIKNTIIRNVITIMLFFIILLIIKYGIYIAKKSSEKNNNIGQNFFPFILYCLMLMGSFNDIFEKLEKIQKSLVISEKLFKIIDYIPNIKNAPLNEFSYMKIKGNIEFKNINFSYSTKKDVEVLNNFNLKIEPGMRIGIVGASGSGKSTIISLLQRLYNCGNEINNNKNNDNNNNIDINNNKIEKLDEYIELPNINGDNNLSLLDSKLIDSDSDIITVDSDTDANKKIKKNKILSSNSNIDDKNSSILVDNVNIKLLDIKNYHNQIGYVCQEPPLFNATILENILYGVEQNCENYDKEEIEKILKMSKAEFVFDENLFPKGLDTLVGEKGSQLSGGQKQRIAIARALIKKPKILILDEATSALDAESEFEIQNHIYNLSKDMNIIIVAHRLSSIKNCDKIIVIDHGKIVESGTHQELINLNGKYKELMEKQMNNNEN